VEAQRDDPGSMLSLVRDLLATRRVLGEGFELLDAAPGVVAYRRGEHAVAVNTTPEERPAPAPGDLVIETRPGALDGGTLAPSSAAMTMGI
jgi:alpha-glucosidase